MEKIPGLRRITTVLDDEEVTLLGVGYLAHALGRTVWTVHSWMRLGLLPPPAFVINPDVLNTRRWLWPEPYLDSVLEIGNRLQIGHRMDRDCWQRFYAEVFGAYEQIVVPHLPRGVTTPVAIQINRTHDGRLTCDSVGEVAAINA